MIQIRIRIQGAYARADAASMMIRDGGLYVSVRAHLHSQPPNVDLLTRSPCTPFCVTPPSSGAMCLIALKVALQSSTCPPWAASEITVGMDLGVSY